MRFKTITTVSIAAVFLVLLAGCEQDGPAEQAGERLDEAVESAGEEVEDAADELRESTELENN